MRLRGYPGRLRIALAVTALGAVVARAQDAPRVVSLDEAVAAAERLPDLAAAEAAVRAAEAGVRLASRWPDVSLGFARRSITARESYSLSAPLPWPGRGARIEAARAEAALAGSDRDASRRIGRRALRLAWFTLAAREDLAAAASEKAARARATADAVESLYDAGRVALVERSRVVADAALAAADAAQAGEEMKVAEGALRRLLGFDPGLAIGTARPLPAFEAEADLASALAAGLARSPVATAADARVRAAEAAVRVAAAERYPGLAVELGADRNDPTQPGTDRSVGVSVTVPIGAGPALDAARAERQRALALRDQAKREIADAVETAWRSAHAARARCESLQRAVIPAATQAADLAQVAYREGRSDIFRVLDAERALAEARTALAEAWLAWGAARADLLQETGEN